MSTNNSYRGGVGIVLCNRTGLMVAVMARLRMTMVRFFVALQRVLLEFKLLALVTNSYDGVGIAGENRTRPEGGSNVGGNDTHEGKNNDATKSSELRERVS